MVEQEQSTGRAGARSLLGLVLVLLLAAALRLFAFTWGLPDQTHLFSYHPDEFHSLRGALSLALGDLNPHFFNYGSLYLYLVALAAMIASPGLFFSVAQTTPGGPELPAAIRAWTLDARIVTLLLALATIYVVYLTASRIWGWGAGLLAAAALAVMPLHVVHSRYATVDVPGAFFVALALYFGVKVGREPRRRHLLWAGVAAGLAASTKYSLGVVIIAPLLAWLLAPRIRGPLWQPPVLVIAGALLAFALTSPYTFLDWNNAWRDISFEMAHMRTGDDPAALARDPNGWWFHLKQLNLALTWPLLGAAVWGAFAGLRRSPWQVAPLVVFLLLAFAVAGAVQVRYARYEMALLPPLAVLVGGVTAPVGPASRRWPQGLLCALGMIAATWLSVLWLLTMGRVGFEDPRLTVVQFARQLAAHEGTIALVSEPWFHHPPIDYCNGGAALRANPIWRAYQRPVCPFIIAGLDPGRMPGPLPDAWIFTSYDLAAPPEQVRAFLQALRGRYAHWWQSDDATGIMWPRRLWPAPAHDWLYPCPVIYWCSLTPVEMQAVRRHD